MKHPFQIITVDRSGKHLFASVKNHLQVFELLSGKLVGSWEDTVDILTPLKKQQDELLKKLIAKQEAEAKEEAEDPEKAEDDEAREESAKQNKKLKNNKGKPVAPKIPTPGPGAPPIYNYIRSLALSKDEKFLVGTTDSDKAAVIFEVDFTNSENCLKLIKRQVFPKRPCAVSIDEDLNLIVADKFGDVYSIRIDHEDAVDEKDLTPILGHVSMLSDVLITSHQGKKFVLTGDRDEHIRVTNFPKAYVIKNWLFGHHEFVSTMHIPEFDDSLLISGGGDDYLCLWNWLENKLVGQIQLRPLLEEHLSDEHFPPTRFRDEKSLKEISINSILTMQAGSKNLLIVGSENSSVLLVFELKHDYTVELLQTLITSKPLVSVCIDSTGKRVIASIDDETDSELLQIYKFNGATLELESSPVTAAISKQNACDVESRSEFYPLYYINTLRKRSDH